MSYVFVNINQIVNIFLQLKMKREHFRLFFTVLIKKKYLPKTISKAYSESTLSVKTYNKYWFRRLKNNDFDLKDQINQKKVRKYRIIDIVG